VAEDAASEVADSEVDRDHKLLHSPTVYLQERSTAMTRLLCGLLGTLWFSAVAQAQSLPEWSIWKNTRTSMLVVSTVDTKTGMFQGSFLSNASVYLCLGYGVPISGKITGNDITFVANFAPCHNAIAVWKGTLSGTTIKAELELWFVDDNNDFKHNKAPEVFTKQ
jgi:hypothetical protein